MSEEDGNDGTPAVLADGNDGTPAVLAEEQPTEEAPTTASPPMTMDELTSKVDKIALQITAIVDAMGVSDEDKEKIKSLATGGRRRRRSRRGKRPRKSRRSRRY